MKKRLILASGSPRRREILEREHITFEIIKATGEEYSDKSNPTEYVSELASNKANEVFAGLSEDFEGYILAADTIVCIDNDILGKPVNEEHAVKMINRIQGRSHKVYTGVCIICKNENALDSELFCEATEVFVDSMTENEINDYVQSGESMDKAGAYAIQGIFSKYINHIEGDYDNVVGLPYRRVEEVLKEKGFFIE